MKDKKTTKRRHHPRKPPRRVSRKEIVDEFIGSEIDVQTSLAYGTRGISAARLRVKAAERVMEAGDAVPGGANWVQMGPQAIPNGQSLGGGTRILVTGRVTGIAIHPTTPSTQYVSGARGGVWKTTDGGATWTAKSDNEISLAIG